MMPLPGREIAWLLLAASSVMAMAGPAEDDAVMRAHIAAERQVLLDRFAAEERACTQRFVVTACVDDLRRRRRDALEPLRLRELELDDAARARRAESHRRELASRRAVPPESRLPRGAASGPGADLPAHGPAHPASGAVTAHEGIGPEPSTDPAQARREAEAARRAKAARERAAGVEAAQDRVARRLAERRAQGKISHALPAPPSGASAAVPASAPDRPGS